MDSLVVLTTRWLDFGAGFAVERLSGVVGGAAFCAGSLAASADTGGAFGFGGFADAIFFAGAFGCGGLGLAGAGAAARSAFCCSDRQAGMWEAALLGRSFFDSGCLE